MHYLHIQCAEPPLHHCICKHTWLSKNFNTNCNISKTNKKICNDSLATRCIKLVIVFHCERFCSSLISHESDSCRNLQLNYVASGEPQFDLLQWERFVFLLGEFQGRFWDCVFASRQQNVDVRAITFHNTIPSEKKWWMEAFMKKMIAEVLHFSIISWLFLIDSNRVQQSGFGSKNSIHFLHRKIDFSTITQCQTYCELRGCYLLLLNTPSGLFQLNNHV